MYNIYGKYTKESKNIYFCILIFEYIPENKSF